jgi:hypothetical protein
MYTSVNFCALSHAPKIESISTGRKAALKMLMKLTYGSTSRTRAHTHTVFNRNTLHEYNLSLSQFRFSKCCVPWLSLAVGWRWGRNLEPSWNSTEKGKQILSKKIKFVSLLSFLLLLSSPSCLIFFRFVTTKRRIPR